MGHSYSMGGEAEGLASETGTLALGLTVLLSPVDPFLGRLVLKHGLGRDLYLK